MDGPAEPVLTVGSHPSSPRPQMGMVIHPVKKLQHTVLPGRHTEKSSHVLFPPVQQSFIQYSYINRYFSIINDLPAIYKPNCTSEYPFYENFLYISVISIDFFNVLCYAVRVNLQTIL